MRMSQFFRATTVLSLLIAAPAVVARTATLDQGNVLRINVNKASIDSIANYPGYPGGDEASDCLTLVAEGSAPVALLFDGDKLASSLVVEDGGGIMFDDREVNKLNVSEVNGRLVWKFKDVGTYVTGVRVRSADGSTLNAVLRAALRAPNLNPMPRYVALLRSQACD